MMFDNVKILVPEPFQFNYELTDKDDREISCTVSGFWNAELQEIEELKIIDQSFNDITALFDDKETQNEIAEALTLNPGQ